MNYFNNTDHIRQQRFRENLRWFLLNQAALELRAEREDLDALDLVEVYAEVTATLAAGKIDVFNAVAERYQRTYAPTVWPIGAVDTEIVEDIVDLA